MKNQSQEEIWKDIKGYEGLYQISNLGRVKSLSRSNCNVCKRTRILRHSLKTEYAMVVLCKNDGTGGKTFCVHHVVWNTFSLVRRGNKTLDHIDNDKHNNRFDNLQLLSIRANNSKAALRKKKSGLPIGVLYHNHRKLFKAMIFIKPKHVWLGSHKTIEQASQAYQNALHKLGEAA